MTDAVEQQIKALYDKARVLENEARDYREQAAELRFGLHVAAAESVCQVSRYLKTDMERASGQWQLIFLNHKGQDYCRLNVPLSERTFEIMTLDEVKVWAHQQIKKNSDLGSVRIEWF